MTQKHFNALAKALRNVTKTPNGLMQWERDCSAVADVCTASDPNFNRIRFLYACGCVCEEEQDAAETDRAKGA